MKVHDWKSVAEPRYRCDCEDDVSLSLRYQRATLTVWCIGATVNWSAWGHDIVFNLIQCWVVHLAEDKQSDTCWKEELKALYSLALLCKRLQSWHILNIGFLLLLASSVIVRLVVLISFSQHYLVILYLTSLFFLIITDVIKKSFSYLFSKFIYLFYNWSSLFLLFTVEDLH